MYAASAKKQIPTTRSTRFPFRLRSLSLASTEILQSITEPEVTSMKLSIPNPMRMSEMLPAAKPLTTATMPSAAFQPMVKYSSLLRRYTPVVRSERNVALMSHRLAVPSNGKTGA